MSQSELTFVRKGAWIHNPRDSVFVRNPNMDARLSGKDYHEDRLSSNSQQRHGRLSDDPEVRARASFSIERGGVDFGDLKHRLDPSRQQRVVLGELFVRAWLAAWAAWAVVGSVSEQAGGRDGFEPSRFQVEQR
jgi:hypothetical protein